MDRRTCGLLVCEATWAAFPATVVIGIHDGWLHAHRAANIAMVCDFVVCLPGVYASEMCATLLSVATPGHANDLVVPMSHHAMTAVA